MEGYITLKEAAAIVGRSTARTRQYLKDETTGLKWIRDEMGHLQVNVASMEGFTVPERGNARASGVNPATHLRHAKATRKLVQSRIADGASKVATQQVLTALIQALAEELSEMDALADAGEVIGDADDSMVIEAPAPVATEDPAAVVETVPAPAESPDFKDLLRNV